MARLVSAARTLQSDSSDFLDKHLLIIMRCLSSKFVYT